jgi:hypothetical protein
LLPSIEPSLGEHIIAGAVGILLLRECLKKASDLEPIASFKALVPHVAEMDFDVWTFDGKELQSLYLALALKAEFIAMKRQPPAGLTSLSRRVPVDVQRRREYQPGFELDRPGRNRTRARSAQVCRLALVDVS